ncbi:hypothetical protein OG782_02545 [Streptomyces sp. NBC_00876]|uniref:hypothetical protein n=1 Tax=Streptomyces sp. NBC_00876 TaxID=2975853 RepID=UPI00386D41DF|nr:hypothetical protein OG782_02545 [Streptomyces sp. NBC_00876]
MRVTEGEAIGCHPLDDAEPYAPGVMTQHGTPGPAGGVRLLGTWRELPWASPVTAVPP